MLGDADPRRFAIRCPAMKQEIKDIAVELATRTTPAGFIAWWTQMSLTGILTGILLVLQIAYLLRKWWREETEWGVKLREWAVRLGLVKP